MASGSYSGGGRKEFIRSSRDEDGFNTRQNFNSSSGDHLRDSRSNSHNLDTTQLYFNVTKLKLNCKRLDYLRKEMERKKKKRAKKEKKNKRQLEESENFKKKKAEYRELYSEILVDRATIDSLFDTSRHPPDDNQNPRPIASEGHKRKSRPRLPQLDQEDKECEKCQQKNTKIWRLEADIEKYKKDIECLQKDVLKLSGEIDQERRDKQDNNRTRNDARNLQHRIAELETRIAKEKLEKEDALRRLSSMASAKLRDNNPNIADLSDPNRPTKIAEKLSEIYDNEWTDAFDQLEKSYSKTEKDNAKLLLDVLIEVHQQCNNLSENVLNNITAPLKLTDIPPEVSKNLKDAVKMLAPYKMNAVAKDIKRSLPSRFASKPGDPFDIYVDKCIDACLHMSVQDPPMYLSADPDKESLFSSALYRAYTKSGKYEVFIVWPVLYLHKNGPMMAKGVAQGTDDKTIIQKSYSQQYQLPVQSQNVVRRQHENQHRPQQHQQQYHQDRYQHGGMQTSYGSSANHRQQQYPSHYLAQGYPNPQFSKTYYPRISTTSQITDF